MTSPGVVGCLAPPSRPSADGMADLLAQVARCAGAGADSVELRLDLLGASLLSVACARELSGAARAAGLALIATCRPERSGGGFAGSEDERASLLAAWAASGADWLDFEAGSGLAARIEARSGMAPGTALERCGVILSRHDSGMPRNLSALAASLAEEAKGIGAARCALKLVPTATSPLDLPGLRDLLAGAGWRERSGSPPLVAFAMGEAGAASRLLARAWGSAGSYWAADPLRPIAPGQAGLEEAVKLHRIRESGSGTWLAGLAGEPIRRSLSPRLHASAFRAERRDALYLPLPCRDFAEGLKAAELLGLTGLSVTIPHKRSASAASSAADRFARESGAANTLMREPGGGWRGWNTDAPALIACLQRRLARGASEGGGDSGLERPAGAVRTAGLAGMTALVIGSGGSARAAAAALGASGVKVWVTARRIEAAREAAALAGGGALVSPAEAGTVDILVQATPAGGAGEPALDLPLNLLRPRIVADYVYISGDGPPDTAVKRLAGTPLILAAAARGCLTVSGLELLVEQAIGQQLTWFGRDGGREQTVRAAMSGAVDLQ